MERKKKGKPESGESGSRKTVVWEPASHGEGTEVERADEAWQSVKHEGTNYLTVIYLGCVS